MAEDEKPQRAPKPDKAAAEGDKPAKAPRPDKGGADKAAKGQARAPRPGKDGKGAPRDKGARPRPRRLPARRGPRTTSRA